MNSHKLELSLHSLVLAGGRGSRFGGEIKQLAMIAGQPMVQGAVSLAQASTPDKVTVVLGYEYEQLSPFVKPAHIIVNSHWQAGMGTSIACGVAGLPASADAVLIFLCDQVAITAADLNRLRTAYEAVAADETIVCAAYAGGVGVPAIFPRAYFPQLGALEGDRGARQLLQANPVLAIPLEAAAIDIDSYSHWQQFTANEAITD